MKQIFTSIIVVLALTLCACGGNATTSTEATEETSTEVVEAVAADECCPEGECAEECCEAVAEVAEAEAE